MSDKPDINEVGKIVPEASGLREIGSGGYKVVYQAQVAGRTEAVKLVRIPGDENDETVRDENLRRIQREITILRECDTPFLVKLGAISPRECMIGKETYVVYSEEHIPRKVAALPHPGGASPDHQGTGRGRAVPSPCGSRTRWQEYYSPRYQTRQYHKNG